jgi:hypothetical protein
MKPESIITNQKQNGRACNGKTRHLLPKKIHVAALAGKLLLALF